MIDYDAVINGMDVEESKPANEGQISNKEDLGIPDPSPAGLKTYIKGKAELKKYGRVVYGSGYNQDGTPINDHCIAITSTAFDLEIAKSKLDADSVQQLVAKADLVVVETEGGAKKAVSLAMQSRKMGNAIEKARKEIVRPMLNFNKAVKQYADEFSKCLKDMETSLLKKVEVYQTKRKEVLKKACIIDTSIDKIVVDDGSGKTVIRWVYDIEDLNAIPIKYLKVDEAAIREAISKGVRLIGGVKIYERTFKQYRVKG